MAHMNSRVLTAVICALLIIGIVHQSYNVKAHSGAKGVVKKRMDAMKSISDQMKILGAIAKNSSQFDSKRVEKSAVILSGHAADIPELFPKGSVKKPSEAKLEIWSDWSKFTSYAKDLQIASDELRSVAKDDFKAVFMKAAQTCKGCHQEFRVKK